MCVSRFGHTNSFFSHFCTICWSPTFPGQRNWKILFEPYILHLFPTKNTVDCRLEKKLTNKKNSDFIIYRKNQNILKNNRIGNAFYNIFGMTIFLDKSSTVSNQWLTGCSDQWEWHPPPLLSNYRGFSHFKQTIFTTKRFVVGISQTKDANQ